MEELLDKITRIQQVRACTVVDAVGSQGTLVTWLRDGGDPVPLELAARQVFEVMSDLLPENPDSPAIAATFNANARLLARRFGNYFAIVICDRDVDLVNVRVALQGLALKISLHQRALSLSDPPRSARQPPQSVRSSPPNSAKSPPAPSPSPRTSDPAISTRSGSPDSKRPSANARAAGSPGPVHGVAAQSVNAIKMRDELVRIFANQLGPLAALLVDEQISAHGGLQDTTIAFAIGETLLAHVKADDQRARVRAELDKLVRVSTMTRQPSAPPDRNTPPYRTMPESIDERKVTALAQLFVEFVGPIGKLVFDEEIGSAKNGALLLRPQARTLVQSLAQHVPNSGRKSFLERAERLLGTG